jgi:hypothetical protein
MEDQSSCCRGIAGPFDGESRLELVGQGCTSIIGIRINDMALFFVEREFAVFYNPKVTGIDVGDFSSAVVRRSCTTTLFSTAGSQSCEF